MRYGLACLCVVGGMLVAGLTGGRAQVPMTAGPALDKATMAEVRKLQEKRRDVLRDALAIREKLYQGGRVELDSVIEASKRLLAAELDLATTGAERIAAHERRLEKARVWVERAKARKKAALGTEADVLDAQALALEAEIGLLKAGGKSKKAVK